MIFPPAVVGAGVVVVTVQSMIFDVNEESGMISVVVLFVVFVVEVVDEVVEEVVEGVVEEVVEEVVDDVVDVELDVEVVVDVVVEGVEVKDTVEVEGTTVLDSSVLGVVVGGKVVSTGSGSSLYSRSRSRK